MKHNKEVAPTDRGHMIREHATAISVGGVVTAATLLATSVWYERKRHQERLVEKYLAKQDVFQFHDREPDSIALMLRKLAATSLLYPDGATQKQLEKTAGVNMHPRMFAFGDGLRLLLREEMLEQFVETRDPKNAKFRPHEHFVRVMLEDPGEWRPLERAAQEHDAHFTIERLADEFRFSEPLE